MFGHGISQATAENLSGRGETITPMVGWPSSRRRTRILVFKGSELHEDITPQ